MTGIERRKSKQIVVIFVIHIFNDNPLKVREKEIEKE